MRLFKIKTTEGLLINPIRTLWHVSLGMLVFIVMVRTYPSTRLVIKGLLVALFAFAAVDIIRLTTKSGNKIFWKHFSFLTSKKEARGPNTSLYYVLSLIIAVTVFEPRITMGAIICLAIGDTVASIVGKTVGRYRIGGKSIEGAIANFLVCFFILIFIVPSTLIALAGALTGALIELLPVPVDDNISIPLVSGFTMMLVSRL